MAAIFALMALFGSKSGIENSRRGVLISCLSFQTYEKSSVTICSQAHCLDRPKDQMIMTELHNGARIVTVTQKCSNDGSVSERE